MHRLLITAFSPFEPWQQNASWLAMQALTSDLPANCEITTRLYPVNFSETRARMASDLATPYDAVLHLGQSASCASITLESFAMNVCREPKAPRDHFDCLEPSGPAGYQSTLPLASLAESIREAGIPAKVSMHAGTYLCNAALYWSHYFAEVWDQPTRATFIHLPLDLSQVIHEPEAQKLKEPVASLPAELSAQAIRVLLANLVSGETLSPPNQNNMPPTELEGLS